MVQVEVGKGYRSQLVQKEKGKEVIHYNFFLMAASKTEEGTCPLGFPSWQEQPYRPTSKHTSKWRGKKSENKALETYIFVGYVSVWTSALVVLICRVA